MEEPVALQVDPPQKLPVSVHFGAHGVVDGLVAIDGELFVKLLDRVEDKKRHLPVMRVDVLVMLRRFADGRARAIATDDRSFDSRCVFRAFAVR